MTARLSILAFVTLALTALPAARGQLLDPEPRPVAAPALDFSPPLPTDPVAWIHDQPLGVDDLCRRLMERVAGTGLSSAIGSRRVSMELKHRDLEVTEAELEREIGLVLAGLGREGADPDRMVGALAPRQLRREAHASRGWKEIYWDLHRIPEDQHHAHMGSLLISQLQRSLEGSFQVRIRGQAGGPSDPEILAEVQHLESGEVALISTSEVLDHLLASIRQKELLDILQDLIDTRLVDRALAEAGQEVSAEEIARYSAAQDQLFENDAIKRPTQLQGMGSSVPEDNERWRRIQAWLRVTRPRVDQEEMMGFLEDNKAYFMNEHRRVSHILVRGRDEDSGLPLPAAELAEAEARAKLIHRKAREGVDFAKLARLYSDDLRTARGDGRMAAQVRPRGGMLDPAFQAATWDLKRPGDISPPVRTKEGWHIIQLLSHEKRAVSEPDWTQGGPRSWLIREYAEDHTRKWIDQLRKEAGVRTLPKEEILALKRRVFWE